MTLGEAKNIVEGSERGDRDFALELICSAETIQGLEITCIDCRGVGVNEITGYEDEDECLRCAGIGYFTIDVDDDMDEGDIGVLVDQADLDGVL